MATLTDRYVQTLVKYNDALTEQRQKDVQKQYNEWERKQRALQTPAVQTPVIQEEPTMQEIPVLKFTAPFANDEAAQKAERAQQINNDFAGISNYIANEKAKQERKAQQQSGNPKVTYTADGKLDVSALQKDPRVQEMTATQNITRPTATTKTMSSGDKIVAESQKWLEPSYKMTKADKESYKQMFNDWKKSNPDAYNAYFAFQTDGEGLEDAIRNYPEIRTILDVQNKLDPIASFMNGARNAFSGAQNLGGMAVKAFGNDDVDRWVDERLERRNREIANAQTQHPIATTGGNVAGMAAQYAMANAALGALSGGRLATQSVSDAYNASKNLGDAAKVFGTNIGKQMIPDLLIDTSSNVINNVSNGADAGTVARDAAGNVLENLAWNALFELPGLGKATYQGIKDLRGLDNEIASLRNVERANIPALGDVTKAVENAPARQIAEDVQQATKEADDLAKVADDVRPVEEAPVRQAVAETANETAEQAARNIAEEINESKVSVLGRNPVTGELSNYGNAIMRRLNELNGLSEARTAALNADPALKEAFGNAWTKYQTEFAKADAGQVNALKAATNDLADVFETVSKVTGENANARRNLEDVYDILMHRNIPRKFEGDMPENINPILNMLDEQSRSNVENSLDTVRNYIDDTVYKNMRAIRGNETLQAKVKDVTDAYDKWIDAVYSGIGDTERLGKDVRNAMGRAERAFAKEGISAFHVPEKMAKQTNLPDIILKQNAPDIGYHAGDLGKAESLGSQSGDRGTGHYGTGTYFVGDKNALASGGYANRPVEAINFANYNLFRPQNYRQGMNLHEYLKGVNELYRIADPNAIKSVDEWKAFRDVVDGKTYSDPYEMYEDLKRLVGKRKLDEYVREYADKLVDGKPLEKINTIETTERLFDMLNAEESARAEKLLDNFELRKYDRFMEEMEKKYQPEVDKYRTDMENGEPRYTLNNDGTWADNLTGKELSEEEFARQADLDRVKNAVLQNHEPERGAVDSYIDFNQKMDELSQDLFGISGDDARNILYDIKKEIEAENFNGKSDSASTRFMKRLGYEGVDVRGIKDLDNVEYGSVIYDLKGKDLEQQAAAKARRKAALEAQKAEKEVAIEQPVAETTPKAVAERIEPEAEMTIKLDGTKPKEENTVEPAKSVTEPVRPNQPNMKTRKTYSNTMQNSDIFPEKELAENPHYAKEEFGYLEQPESESLEKASDILASNKEGQKRRFASEVLTPETAKRVEASDIDSIYMMIRENNEAIENAIDAAEIARLRRENGIMTQNLARINTNAGQVVQANAKWSRTPEGMRIQADAFKKGKVDEILKEANWGGDVTRLEDNIVKRIDELIDSKMWDDLKASDGIDSENGLNLIRDELAKEINNAAAKAKKNISNTDVDNLAKKIQQKLLASPDIDKIEDQLMSDDIWQMVAGVGDITEEHMDEALKLLDEAKQFNPNSKDAAQRIDAAYLILANDIGHGKSIMDKLDAWRYFAMLSKPTTHLRNMLGNTTFGLVTGAENSLSAVMEAGLDRASKIARHGKGIDRTKSLLGPQDVDLIKACARDFSDNAYGLYKGNKYYEDLAAGIEKMVKTFNDKGAGKAANFLTETNTALLDAEDVLFGQSKYATSLAGYLKANGYGIDALKSEDTAIKRVVEDARAYALSKANEATFHNNSAFAKLSTEIDRGLREWSRLDWGNGNSVKKAVGLAGRHIVPFAKTPANILSSILSRGPQESGKVLYDLVQLAKHNPNVKAKDLIEDISKTASGTMILCLGAYLYSTGHIELGGETDNERFNKKSRGITGPSLKFGNTYVALNDGNVPTAILAMGANLAQAYKGKKGGLDAFFDGLASVSDTVVDTTMLSGLADVLNSARYSKDNADLASRIGMQVITNASGQYIPNLTRGLENVVDSEKRNTAYTGQTGVMDTAGKSLQYASTGIPFLQEGARAAKDSGIPILEDIGNVVALNPQVDRWGNDIEKVGGNALGRLANNTINPTSITTDQSNALDKEIDRLYKRLTDDTNGEPIMSVDDAKKLFTYTPNAESKFDGEPLSRDEWYKYQQERGKSRYDLMNAVVNSRYYRYLTDEEKATMLKEMDDISKNYTREKYGAEIKNKKMAKLVDAYKEGGAKAVLDIKGENIDTTRTPETRMKEYQKAQAEEQKFEAVSDDIMGTLQKAGVVDKYAESVPKEAREAYAEYGMQGVEDYATVKSNKKGASYDKYRSLKSEIPTLTAKEYADIYNNYSVPNKKGEYDNYFTKDTELIPYLTSRAWDNDEQLNIYAHALSPSVEGTWYIRNNQLYYNKPSVEKWQGK